MLRGPQPRQLAPPPSPALLQAVGSCCGRQTGTSLSLLPSPTDSAFTQKMHHVTAGSLQSSCVVWS